MFGENPPPPMTTLRQLYGTDGTSAAAATPGAAMAKTAASERETRFKPSLPSCAMLALATGVAMEGRNAGLRLACGDNGDDAERFGGACGFDPGSGEQGAERSRADAADGLEQLEQVRLQRQRADRPRHRRRDGRVRHARRRLPICRDRRLLARPARRATATSPPTRSASRRGSRRSPITCIRTG